MPGLLQHNAQFVDASSLLSSSGLVLSSGIWSEHLDDVTFDQLQKFWRELSPQERKNLLRIDKQTLIEQARKNLYCSRCNGLLLESYLQIATQGKHEDAGNQDEIQDPSTHIWGGLAATKDGALTLLEYFFGEKSFKSLRKVFDCGRARERERELLYPNACGGGNRGWISQGIANCGRGHGVRETCALHTARLSCATLTDFWSALSDETRQSLFRMKEEDFVEKLMFRFDRKRFCRDCRKNVIREFKEVKELKRIRKEPYCTNWFCVADTAFQYEVSDNTIRADWHQSFTNGVGSYVRFEWGVGTGEGKSDIMDFKDVGLDGSAVVNGLNLHGMNSCYITLRAWKADGKYREFSVKAHALKGKECVHRRLMVGDGFVTLTTGESIQEFFEHAEEIEEEEDDDSLEKNDNDFDGDDSRPQKHAKSPELARDCLLDAALVIFKNQVEKAFREGTARQNAHSTFVGLALKLLEERIQVACKEIITVKKQKQLLEEEEKEKREEEERRERRRTKEKGKKLRKKERLREKENENENVKAKELSTASDTFGKSSSLSAHEHFSSNSGDSLSEAGENMPISPTISEQPSENITLEQETAEVDCLYSPLHDTDGNPSATDNNGFVMIEHSKSSRRKLRLKKEFAVDSASRQYDTRHLFVGEDINFRIDDSQARRHACGSTARPMNGLHRNAKTNLMKFNARHCDPKSSEKNQSSKHSICDRFDYNSSSSNQHIDCSTEDRLSASFTESAKDLRTAGNLNTNLGVSTSSFDHYTKAKTGYCDNLMNKNAASYTPFSQRDSYCIKNVWEPLELQKMKARSSSYADVVMRSCDGGENKFLNSGFAYISNDDVRNFGFSGNDAHTDASYLYQDDEDYKAQSRSSAWSIQDSSNFGLKCGEKSAYYVENIVAEHLTGSSSSDNFSTCHSEESATESSGAQVAEYSCTSDSEDSSQYSESREISSFSASSSHNCLYASTDVKVKKTEVDFTTEAALGGQMAANGKAGTNFDSPQPLRQFFSETSHFPVFPSPSALGYYQTPHRCAESQPDGLSPSSHSNSCRTGSLNLGMLGRRSPLLHMQLDAKKQPLMASIVGTEGLPRDQMPGSESPASLKEQMKTSNLGGKQDLTSVAAVYASKPFYQKLLSNKLVQQKSPLPPEPSRHSKPLDNDPNFSLFHFGGPIAMYEVRGAESSKLVRPLNELDSVCYRENNSLGEYSLFSKSNGSRFWFL